MRILQILSFSAASLIAICLATQSTYAQEAEDYPLINRIIIEFDGFRSTSDQYVMGNVQLRPGMNYDPAVLDQSIRALYSTAILNLLRLVSTRRKIKPSTWFSS